MAFSYQKNFGVPTENVGHELMFSLLRDHNKAWMVEKIRQIKSTAHERDWTTERDYQAWFDRLDSDRQQALAGKSTEQLALAWADSLKRDLFMIIFIGNFDEFRLRDAVSSADWVKAEYDQASGSFLTAGAATDVTGGGTPARRPQVVFCID